MQRITFIALGIWIFPPSGLACQSYLAELAQYTRVLRDANALHARVGERELWPEDGRASGETANRYFGSFLHFDSVDLAMEARRRTGKSTHVVEFFGSALFPTSLDAYDSVTGIRNQPIIEEEIPAEFWGTPRWTNLHGDIYSSTVWKDIDRRLETLHREGFDLILARPIGALTRVSARFLDKSTVQWEGYDPKRAAYAFAAINYRMLNRMWQRLSSDGGKIVLQIDRTTAAAPVLNEWLELLQAGGIKAELAHSTHRTLSIRHRGHPALLLERGPEGPDILPFLEQ